MPIDTVHRIVNVRSAGHGGTPVGAGLAADEERAETVHRRADAQRQPYRDESGFEFRLLRIPEDIPLLHGWLIEERAAFWQMRDKSEEQVRQAYAAIMDSGHATAYLGWRDDGTDPEPAFLAECYDPAHDRIREFYDVQPGDLGMHVFIGPCAKPIPGYSRSVFYALMRFMLLHLGARRIVVEPDARNHKIHALNRSAGFVYDRDVVFPEKTASLAFCTRREFEQATAHTIKEVPMNVTIATQLNDNPAAVAAHLTPEVWDQANRLLLRKAIAEYAHEQIVEPELVRQGTNGFASYRLFSDDGTVRYEFEAQGLALRHWYIRPESIRRLVDDAEQPLDALKFIIECRKRLAIREELLPVYLDEISSTLSGSAFKRSKADAPGSAQLADAADFQTIEVAMAEGHPGFVANNGRLGFDAVDYRTYAPEAGADIRVVWLAVHKDHATFASISSLTYEQLLAEEIGQDTVERYTRQLADLGLDPASYYFMPAHPWQWYNKLSITFSAYIAQRKIVCLGYGKDNYTAQQSIRTFFNKSERSKRYVKTSLSILNMGFMRGLSPYYMSGTPAINEYLEALVSGDAELRENGFTILREVASIGFRNHYYEAAIPADTPYKKMFSALWRESPLPLLKPGERLMTMAALLHVDRDGKAVLPELMRRSGLAPTAWLKSYFKAYLTPLLHCFYKHDLTFMPHGENLILVLDHHVPVRAIMKDIAEECAILNIDARASLPPNVERLAVDLDDEFKLLGIFIDVFDGVLRHMNQIVVEYGCCTEDDFWGTVASCVADYQDAHPEQAAKHALHDMFTPEFMHSCLNRLQLGNNMQMVNLADPASSLKVAGMLANPIAKFRRAAKPQAQPELVAESLG